MAFSPATATTTRQYNFEIKCLDGTANPYFAIAAVLSAGLDGVRNGLKVEMQNCEGKNLQSCDICPQGNIDIVIYVLVLLLLYCYFYL